MTRSTTVEDPINGNNEEYDNLTRIKGIRPVKQQLLIEGWIVQTQELAAEQSPQRVPLIQRTEEEALTLLEAREWSSFASFTVELQRRVIGGQLEEKRTLVRHLETDQLKTWSEIEIQQLPQWMLKQLSIEMRQPAVEQRQAGTEAESSATPMPIVVEITQLRAFQPPKTEIPIVIDKTSQMFLGMLSRGKPFVLEINLQLAELTTAQMERQPITYYAQCYVRDRSTGFITHLGDTETGTLVEGQLSYIATLPETSLPPGMYRLQVLLTIQGVPATPGFLEVPLLPVV